MCSHHMKQAITNTPILLQLCLSLVSLGAHCDICTLYTVMPVDLSDVHVHCSVWGRTKKKKINKKIKKEKIKIFIIFIFFLTTYFGTRDRLAT